jgi:ATP-dependent Clp protease ATP-binding subunit ClpB
MRADKLTTKFQQALSDAQSIANGGDNQFIEPQHLLLAMLDQDDGAVSSLLSRAGAQVPRLKAELARAVEGMPKVQGHGGDVQVSRSLSQLLNLTDREAQKRGDEFIASEMFLLAAVEDKGEVGRALKEAGVTRKALEAAVETLRGGSKVDSQEAEGQREALKKYTIDLTERARMGKLDPVIGRDDEIRRVLPSVREAMPPSVEISEIVDRSESVRESVFDSRPMHMMVPLQSLSRTLPLTVACEASMRPWSNCRSGLNQ